MYRVVRPGGRIATSTPVPAWTSLNKLEQALRNLGFSDVGRIDNLEPTYASGTKPS